MNNPFGTPNADESDDIFEAEGLDDTRSFRIPEGRYRARTVDLEKDISKSGNPMWIWTFRVTQGPQEGTELKLWTALTAAAMWKIAEVVDALQLPHEEGRTKFNRTQALGKECMITVEDSEYQGRVNSAIILCEVLE